MVVKTLPISNRLSRYFDSYAAHHKNERNQLLHDFGIPALTLAVLAFLSWIPVSLRFLGVEAFKIDAALIVMLLSLIWFLFLDWKVAIPFALCLLGFYLMARGLPVLSVYILFILGFFLQATGHLYYEKNRPAFFNQAVQLLIGPLWLFAKRTGYLS